jgi:hypothetical protein
LSLSRALIVAIPTLAIGGVVVVAFLAGRGDGTRAAMERNIRRSAADPSREALAERQISEYLYQYRHSADARWFAAESFLSIRRPGSAALTVWQPSEEAGDLEVAARFSRLYLRARARPSASHPFGEPAAVAALVHAGDEEARQVVRSRVRSEGERVPWVLEIAVHLARWGSPVLAEAQDALRAAATGEGRLAAAMTGATHADDAALLRRVLEGGAGLLAVHRTRAASSLGALADPEAARFLRDGLERARRSGATSDEPVWLAGLAATGDGDALGSLASSVAAWELDPGLALAVVDAIARGLRRGDAAAWRAAASTWEGAKTPVVPRGIASALVFGRIRSPAAAADEGLFERLGASEDPVVSVLEKARRLGEGDRGAGRLLMEAFLRHGAAADPTPGTPAAESLLLAARALAGPLDRP